ncbi:MAG: PRC-barrel domain-containing protein [Bacillota bacterium]
MRKSKQFQGMSVVSLEEGQQIGSVRGLVINPALKNVAALIIEQKGWFREQKFVPFSKVHSIGEDVITIDRVNRAEKGTSLPEILKLFKDKVNIIGSRLVAENGAVLGLVEEYYVDLQTGDIVGLEFSGGTVNNLFKGSAFLDINYVRTLGTSIIICSNSSIDNIVKMDGGLQEALRNFRENTGHFFGSTFQKTKDLGRSINQSIEKLRKEKKSNGDNEIEEASAENNGKSRGGTCSCGHHEEEHHQEEPFKTKEDPDTAEPQILKPPEDIGANSDQSRKEN